MVEYTFDQHSNANSLQMQDDSVSLGTLANSDFSTVDKVAIVFDDDDGTSYNSTDDADIISFSADGIITLELGGADLPVGSYEAYFDVYYNGVTLPVRWSPKIRVRKI